MSSGSHFRVSMTLSFREIVRHNIFSPEFTDPQSGNVIEFPKSGIAAAYGPNGIEKSSLAAVLASEAGAAYDVARATDDQPSFPVSSENSVSSWRW